jgi:ParB-like chromosome segregation protein Spo0J
VSELEESTAATSSPDAPRSARSEDLVRILGDRPVVEREGLPRGYRMRADSHYVDQLDARDPGPAIRLIPTRQIDVDPSATAGPQALAKSIALHGVVQPLLVRRRNGRYQLIAGRKRLAAAIAAGVTDVPCLTYDVDDTEAATLAQADNLRFPDESSFADAESVNHVLRVLTVDLARIGSSASLLGPTPHRAFQHRVAVDFIQAQAWRTAWLASATTLVLTPPHAGRVAALSAIVDRVKAGFEPERRLTRLVLDTSIAPAVANFAVEDESAATALSGAVFATLAWLEGVEEPRIELRADAPAARTVKIEVVQRTAVVSAEAGRYLREPGQVPATDLAVALGLLGAKSLAVQHGGTVEFTPITGGGSIIQFTLTKPNAN